MTTRIWEGGDGVAVAMVSEAEIDGYDGTTNYGITINGHTVSVLATVDAATTITALVVALNLSTITEFTEITWAEGSTATHVKGTMDTAGVPFVATTFEDGAGTMDPVTGSVLDAVTANAGPNEFDTTQNWSGNTVPVNGDDVICDDTSSTGLLYGLDQSGITLASLTIKQSFAGASANIGLPKETAGHDITSTATTGSYTEYRDDYLKISATSIVIGEGSSEDAGSGRLKINVGSNVTTVDMYNKGTRLEAGIPAVLLLGTHADNTINVNKGDVGLAIFGGEVSTFKFLKLASVASVPNDATVVLGGTVTHTAAGTIIQDGGTLDTGSTFIAATMSTGTFIIRKAAASTALTINGGTCRYQSSGTPTAIIVTGQGTLDFTRDSQARTVTDCSVYEGATVLDGNQTVTWSNPIKLPQTNQQKVTLDLGTNITLAPVAI